VATLPTERTTPAATTDGSTVLFAADQPINAVVRLLGLGSFTICESPGVALPAGTPFPVPANLADAFEAQYGPRPDVANVSAEARQDGLIRGLRRLA
jgi:hypothetical protein